MKYHWKVKMSNNSQPFQEPLLHQKELMEPEMDEKKENVSMETVNKCSQLLLVLALSGVEMIVCFEQIYQILFLQYLDVPVHLVSINGVVCGCVGIVLLPALGILGDRGSNPKYRKTVILLLGLLMFLVGLFILAVSAVVKLINPELNTSIYINDTTEVTPEARKYTKTNLTYLDTQEGNESQDFPLTALMSITSFALMDIGYDMSMSLTRAYVLGMVPGIQHTSLLMMATVVQALAGTAFSSVGCFDFPSILDSVFNVEGVAATLIFFCVLLFVIIVIGYMSTILTGAFISCRRNNSYVPLNQDKSSIEINVSDKKKASNIAQRQQLNCNHRPFSFLTIFKKRNCTESEPLLSDNNLQEFSSTCPVTNPVTDNDLTSEWQISTSSIISLKSRHGKLAHCQNAGKEICYKTPDTKICSLGFSSSADNLLLTDASSRPLHSFVKQSITFSTSEKTASEFPTQKQDYQGENRSCLQKMAGSRHLFSRRVCILLASSFFSIGACICIGYSSNALTVSIYGGDPVARVGTEGYHKYKEGLRISAFGYLVLYIFFLLNSLGSPIIVHYIGELFHFVLSHCLFIVSLLILLLTQTVEAYFVYMMFCGVFKSTVYTLCYVLVNKFYLEQQGTTDSDQDIGKLMSMIGFLIPSHYMLISSFMGPLIDMTENTWTPLMYSLVSGLLGLVIFSTLFCVKNQLPVSCTHSRRHFKRAANSTVKLLSNS